MAENDITFNIGFKVNEEEVKAMTKKIARQGSGFDFSKSNINNADMITAFNKQQAFQKRQYEIAIQNAKHNQESIKKITELYKKQTSVDKFGRTPYQRFVDKRNGIDPSIYRTQDEILRSIHRPKTTIPYSYNSINTEKFRENRENRDRQNEQYFKGIAYGLNQTDPLNTLEKKNEKLLTLTSNRNYYKRAYLKSDSESAKNYFLSKYTSTDEELKAFKNAEKTSKEKKQIVEEGKAHNRELSESVVKAGKLYAIYLAIKKAVQAIVNLAKGFKNVEFGVVSQDYAEKGFFSVDAKGASNANNVTTRASIMRGLQNLGSAAPFSIGDYDSATQKMQELRTKALSGQGISSDQYVISLQRLSDTLGLGFNAKDIMTNSNINLSDFLKDIMGSVEKFLPELDKLDDVKKSLATNDILNVFGAGLANAMMANANYNMRTGNTQTVVERVVSSGTSAFNLVDFTESARSFVDALSKATDATNDFKKGLAKLYEKPAEGVIKTANKVVDWANNILDKANVEAGVGYLLYNEVGDYNYNKDDKKSSLAYWKRNEKEINERLAKGINSESDIWFQLLHDPSKKGTLEARAEGFAQYAMLDEMFNKMNGGSLSDIENDESLPEAQRKFAKALISSGWHNKDTKFMTLSDFRMFATRQLKSKEVQALFGEDKDYDYYGQDFGRYLKSLVSENMYERLLYSAITSEPLLGTKTTGANFMETVGGKYVLRIELSNNKSFDIPMSAIANNESSTIEYQVN